MGKADTDLLLRVYNAPDGVDTLFMNSAQLDHLCGANQIADARSELAGFEGKTNVSGIVLSKPAGEEPEKVLGEYMARLRTALETPANSKPMIVSKLMKLSDDHYVSFVRWQQAHAFIEAPNSNDIQRTLAVREQINQGEEPRQAQLAAERAFPGAGAQSKQV